MSDPALSAPRSDEVRAIEWECQRLLHRLFIAADAGRFEAAALLFAPDGEWKRARGVDRGRRAIVETYRTFPPRVVQHVLGNVAIDAAPNLLEANAAAYVIAFLHPGEASGDAPAPLDRPHSTLEFTCGFRASAEGWQIGSLSSRFVFQAP